MNRSSCLYSWRFHGFHSVLLLLTLLAVSPAFGQEEDDEEPSADGQTLVFDNCLQCHRADDPKYPEHNLGWIFGRRYDATNWRENVDRMEAIALEDGYISDPWPEADKQEMVTFLVEQTTSERAPLEKWGQLHFAVVHFPIALILAGGALEILWMLIGWPVRRDALHALIWLAFLSTGVATAFGYMLIWEVPSMSEAFHDHREAALWTLGLMAGAVILREIAASSRAAWPAWTYRLVLLLAMVAVSFTGHIGGAIVHGEYFDDLFPSQSN